MNAVLQTIRSAVVVFAIAFGPRLAIAAGGATVLRPFESFVDFICGPFAMVLVPLALAGAIISLMFGGGQYIGRLLIALFGGVGLFILGQLRDWVADMAR